MRAPSYLFAALLPLLLALPRADAVLPPQVYEQARQSAALHLQVLVRAMTPPAATPGLCAVQGEVARVLRDRTGGWAAGRALTFDLACTRPEDTPVPGPQLWLPLEEIRPGRFVDAYLDVDGDGALRVARWNASLHDELPPAEPEQPGAVAPPSAPGAPALDSPAPGLAPPTGARFHRDDEAPQVPDAAPAPAVGAPADAAAAPLPAAPAAPTPPPTPQPSVNSGGCQGR